MPRGTKYSEELRQEARELRRQGWSLGEIVKKLGPPKNTLTLWVRDIVLTPAQQVALLERETAATSRNIALAAAAHRQGRLDRIAAEREKAEQLLDTITEQRQANHVALAMLYLGEGAKGETVLKFGNSNPTVIRHWLHLLRSSFALDEAKFRLRDYVARRSGRWRATGVLARGDCYQRRDQRPCRRPDS